MISQEATGTPADSLEDGKSSNRVVDQGGMDSMDTEEVKEYIGLNARKVWGVAPLAADLQIPLDKLRKEFRRKEGLPLSRFILMTKVENAKKLLAETDKYCFEICFDVGFPREDVGARIFKRVTGMTMLEYREEKRR